MKGTITCHLCQRAIAEHRQGELCWLIALANGAVRPLVVHRPVPVTDQPLTSQRVATAI